MKKFRNKRKTITTQDLYLLQLYKYYDVSGDYSYTYYRESPTGVFVLAHKEYPICDRYIDVFTGTTYTGSISTTKENDAKVAHVVSPIISNKGEITYEEAMNILETHNFYLIDKKCKDNTKKLLIILQNFNKLSNSDPKLAEKFATIVIDKFDIEFEDDEEKMTEKPKTINLDKKAKKGRRM